MTVRMTGKLPENNGLGSIADMLVREPHGKHIVIAVIDCARITIDTDTDEAVPVARIRRIEVIRGDDVQESHAAALLQSAADRRNGIQPLPFDMYVIADVLATEAEVPEADTPDESDV